ncbi:MAG: hypothetical protein LBS11_00950 [Oscillospiraceae bacterium]|jgi:hypothetical protein|nr:hypothetical protein [Oscillospiraceae bacterium]
MKRLTAILCSLLLIAARSVAQATPLAKEDLAQGVFEVNWTPEGYSELRNYFHFYPNGVFYLSIYSGQTVKAGFWTLVDQPLEYNAGSVDEPEMKTAPQYVSLANPDGSAYLDMALDDEVLWNLPDLFERDFAWVPDSGHSPDDEQGVTMQDFIVDGDDYAELLLKHNGTFEDTVDSYVEGTWAVDGLVYTLTDADTGGTYNVAVSEDGNTALYTAPDGTEYLLKNRGAKGEARLVFTGSAKGAYGDMDATITCYDSGVAEGELAYAGTKSPLNGSWSMSGLDITLTITDVEYASKLDMATMTAVIELTLNDGVSDVTVPVTANAGP